MEGGPAFWPLYPHGPELSALAALFMVMYPVLRNAPATWWSSNKSLE